MYLDKDEEKMLSGEYGEGTRKALQYQVKIGDFFGAERMVPISIAFVGFGGGSPRNMGAKFFNELNDLNTFFRVPLAISSRFNPLLEKLGAVMCDGGGGIPMNNCAFPHFGSHVSVGGSHPVCFVNTVIGARSNIDGWAGCMFDAITGRTPEHGFHLPENRIGKVLVEVKVDLKNEIADWSAMGYYIGKVLSTNWWNPPVFVGTPPDPLWDSLSALTQTLPVYGSVVMAHIVNTTPEARTLKDAFAGEKPEEKIMFGEDELKEIYNMFTPSSKKVDVVNMRLTVRKLYKVAHLLKGNRIHRDVKLWLSSTPSVKAIADKYGLGKIIEVAGGQIGGYQNLWTESRRLGIKTVAADDAKMLHYIGQQDVECALMPLEKCIEVAITGKLE